MVRSMNAKIRTVTAVNKGRSGVVYHPGRSQPYTVWYRGLIHYFSADERDAVRCFQAIAGTDARKEGAAS